MDRYQGLFVSLIACFVAGCGAGREPAPVDELGAPPGTTMGTPGGMAPLPTKVPPTGEAVTIPLADPGLPPGDSVASRPPGTGGVEPPANPAVVSLLNEANLAMQNGRDDRAAASLERALSIEPRNAWLWHRLASTRLRQGDLSQAAALAAKSNSFASPDRTLQAANWRIIADVHRRRGEFDAANGAEEQANRLETP